MIPTWSDLWLGALTDAGITTEQLEAGRAYARNDTELDPLVDAGRIEATAGASRRVPHEVIITATPLDPDRWRGIIAFWSRHPSRSRELLDGRITTAVLDDLVGPGPEGNESPSSVLALRNLRCTCSCVDARSPCRHAAATLVRFGEHLDEHPLELLRFHGCPVGDLRVELAARHALTTASGDRLDAATDWRTPSREVPRLPTPPELPGRLAPFASEPPPSAPFTADGLLLLADDAARRAWGILRRSGTESDRAEASALTLDVRSDLARRAAAEPDRRQRRAWAERAGITAPELDARAEAWTVAGSAGVDVHADAADVRRLGPELQLRRHRSGTWFRFEKHRGRWRLVSPEPEDPDS